jgi:amino-acid N-acetyltransferase
LEYRQAIESDFRAIHDLLECHDLPANDCKEHLKNFVVAVEDDKIVGVGGFEHCENSGLLRSFAIHQAYEGLGIAKRIFEKLKANAKSLKIEKFYLLTTTASEYFKRFGFSECPRGKAPTSIVDTKQFRELCPDSASMMVISLE